MNNYLQHRLKANWHRKTVLEMGVMGKSGHVTTAFSLSELLISLYHGGILKFDVTDPLWEGRDRFILSEGQAGIGLYPILADIGFFPVSYLNNFLGVGSTLGVHAEPNTPGIELLTGSLGHGLPIATGMADAAKIDGKDWLTVCLVGDGELYEGSNWEAMLTASRLKLDNLILIVNRNHQFTIGFTDRDETQRDVILDPLSEKLESFGFEVRTAEDGHSFPSIFKAFEGIRGRNTNRPLAIIVETVKGNGSSAIANQRGYHYKVPKGDVLIKVRQDLNKEFESLCAEEKGELVSALKGDE